jgi:UDPglucose--hexose-1-phosphate uridylyltransferase
MARDGRVVDRTGAVSEPVAPTAAYDPPAAAAASTMSSTAWEQRWHPLRREWVVVAAHRQQRPWVGATVVPSTTPPAYAPDCFLCPGNARSSGQHNPRYASTFVFDNDHPCVGPDAPADLPPPPAPYRVQPATGHARVLCYSPRHDLTLAEMEVPAIAEVIGVWQQQTSDLGRRPGIAQVLIFENKGEVVGVSNPHPHGQIYATSFVWKTTETELAAQRAHRAECGRPLFADILAAEEGDGRRVLFADEHVLAFVPWFARYAYEVYVAPRRPVPHVSDLRDAEVESLARALQAVTVRYDNLWRLSFPYVMPLHQAPTDGGDYGDFHFFVGFLPPLRQPNLLKFLAGPEIGGGNFLSDTSPEAKAAELRALPDVHYKRAGGAA